jgi:hypothetical protein
MKKTILMGLMAFCLIKGNAQNGQDSTVTMPAGRQFAASGWKQLWWGKHYRKEWITPVNFPVLNMGTFKGGLAPLKAGGGHESKTLRLQAGDGKEYVMRTIDKDLDVLIPEEFKGTFINDLVNDQISTAHPYGPLAIARLAGQLSLMHTNPVILYVPDAPQLGEFRSVFANKLCLLEERPSGKGWDHTTLTNNADDVLNTEDLLEKVSSNTKNKVDQPEFLKVRLFDMIVNDWDRHEDQWVWGKHEKENKTVYMAFGRDRDQAFSKTDGIAIYLLSRPWALRPLQNMTPTLKDILGSNFSARFLDRQFLNELKKEDWEQAISFIRTNLTDESIRQAVNTMPVEANKISGEFIVKRLMQRRDNLPGYSMKYYSILSKRVTIAGAEKMEQFIVDNVNENEIAVTGLRSNSDTFFHRIFYRNETKEINIYGLDDDDQFTFTGTGKNKFIVRALGGKGNNTYTNTKTSGGGKKIRIYDSLYNQDLSRKMFCVNKKSDSLFQYNRKSVKYDWYVPIIIPSFNPDDGFAIGLGFLYRKQKWGKTPFGWQQRLTITYATGTSAIGFGYRGIFKQTFGKWDLDLDASYKGPRYTLNYYGLGNNSTLDSNSKHYYRVKSTILLLNPGISRSWPHSSLRFGLQLQTVDILQNQDKFITSIPANVDPAVFDNRMYGGVNGEWIIATDANSRNPQKGISFTNGFSYLHNFESSSRNLLELHTAIAFYFTLGNVLTFAHRTGAETNFGEYEFYQANTLGGNENLRGYWRSRFAGKSSFYQNTELRCKLAHLKGYVLRGQLGLTGFIDDGRVWEKNEISSQIHVGYGGGLYFLPYNALALNLYYASSKETNMVVLRAGFFF